MKKYRARLSSSRLLFSLTAGLMLTLVGCGPGGDGPSGDTTPPAAPSGLRGTAGNQLVNLNWTANTESDLASYTLMYGTNAQTLSQSMTVEKSKVAQTVTQLSNGTAYSFALKATDTSGNASLLSSVITLTPAAPSTPDTTPPAVPTGLNATAGNAQVHLTWTASNESDLKQYVVKYGTAASALTQSLTVDAGEVRAGQMAATISSLTNGTSYFFAVRAEDNSGNASALSSMVNAKPQASSSADTTPPAVPTGLTATAGDKQIDLTWTANTESDLKEYVLAVFGGSIAPGEPQVIRIPKTQTSYRLVGLTNGSTYTMTLAARDESGNVSGTTAPVAATPKSGTTNPPTDTTPPAVPTGVTAAPTSQPKELQVNWQANTESDLKEYRVTYTEGSNSRSVTVDKTMRQVTLKDLKDTTEYTVQVEAVDTSGNRSAKSSAVKATTRDPYQAPFVKTYSPLTSAVGVATNAEVNVEFSTDMNRQSVEQALKLKVNNQDVTPTITWLSNRAMKFKPAAGYAYGGEVQWMIEQTARSADGAAPNGTFEAHFRVVRLSTVILPMNQDTSGYIRYQPTPVIGGYDVTKGILRVGDQAVTGFADWQYRGFASFDLSSLPDNISRFVDATLTSQRTYVASGNPFSSLGKLQLHRVKVHNPLQGSDFNATQQNCVSPTSGESFACYRSVDQVANAQTFDVLDMVESDWAERSTKGKNSAFRFKFDKNSSDNGDDDFIWINSLSLRIRFEYP